MKRKRASGKTKKGDKEMTLNSDIKARDEMIFGTYDTNCYSGGIRRFRNLSLEKLESLVNSGFADPDETQNYSPSIREFIEFMVENDGYLVDGYVVSGDRDDYRVSVDAIHRGDMDIETKEELANFVDFARHADEFNPNGYAWWD